MDLARFDGHGASPVAITIAGETDFSPEELIPAGDRLYFTAWTAATGYEWFSVGASETSATSHEVVPGIGEADDIEIGAFWDGWFYFLADDGSGMQIWRTSGATVETVTGLAGMSTSYTRDLFRGLGASISFTTTLRRGPSCGAPTARPRPWWPTSTPATTTPTRRG